MKSEKAARMGMRYLTRAFSSYPPKPYFLCHPCPAFAARQADSTLVVVGKDALIAAVLQGQHGS